MAQPVWTLSVDLQTKTATFQSGLADAAKAARSSFTEIKDGASGMGSAVGHSATEARHGVMLLGEEFGVHLPRGITTFIASLGPVGSAMEAAFPFLAIAVGATLLLEHLAKLHQEGEKLTESQAHFGVTVANVLTALDNKLLEAGIRADELNNNHLAALNKQLALIDHQSLAELEHSFDEVAKAADVTFAQLKTTWYQFGEGSRGAQHALTDFKMQYDALLAQGKNKEASDLLSGTKASAERVLELQKQAANNQTTTGTHGSHMGDYVKFEEAKNELKKRGVGFTEKEIEAQETLLDTLKAQVDVESKVKDLKALQEGNARQTTQNKVDTDSDKSLREQSQAQRKEAEEQDKIWEEHYREAVDNLQTNEREKIDATRQGSAARLAAVDAAIKEEESKGLQDTGFYRGLLTSRVSMVREMAEQESKIKEEAAKEDAEHTLAMERLQLAAQEEADRHKLTMRGANARQITAEEIKSVQEATQIEIEGYNRQIAALDQYAADYTVKLKGLQDKIAELEQQSANKIQKIQDQANEKQAADLKRAYDTMANDVSRSLGQVLTRHETFSKFVMSLADQAAQGLAQNALKAILADDMTKPHDAAAAARSAYLAGMKFPWPTNLVMAPALAAGAFAAVMAFESGGIVPGTENADVVPARLMPGEAVLPKALTEQLSHAAKFGPSQQAPAPHVHVHYSPQIHAIDGPSVRQMLDEHSDEFHAHFESHVRKLNR